MEIIESAAVEPAEPSVREAVEAAIESLPQEPVESAAPEQTAAERARDEHGRFARGAEAPADAVKPNATAPETPAAPSSPAEPVAIAPLPRPQSWKGGEVEKQWATLPPLVQQEIQRREADYQRGITQANREAQPLTQALAPFRELLQQHGADPGQLVGSLLTAHKTLALGAPGERLGLFQKLAQDYGIPLQALYDQNARNQYLASQPAQPQRQAPPAPDMETLVERAIMQREVRSEVKAFESDTQTYPAYAYVKQTMAQYIESGEAPNLQEAYRMALEAPEHALIAKLLTQQPAQASQPGTAAAAHVRAARASAVSPRSATPMTGAGASNGKIPSVREAVTAAVERLQGASRV